MKIHSPAKINLFLHITGKRPDGYHDIHSLMACVSLHDTLTLDFNVPEITVSCTHPDVPENETNIAYRAARCFFDALSSPGGVAISIDKQIPVAAGLGGGSSNAACILTGMNAYYGLPFSYNDLASMGKTLGADVPFFIFQKPAIATGIGEKLDFYKWIQPYPILLVHPDIRVSTEEVYKNLNFELTNCKQKLKSFVLNTKFDPLCHLCNDLETVTVSWHPEIEDIKNKLLNEGALGALMSGSGPTVLGIFSKPDLAKKAYDILSRNQMWSCYFTQLLI